MATVKVSGEITEIKETKTGRAVINLIEFYLSNNGEEWSRRWTIWPGPGFENMQAGDFLEVEGTLSTKAVEWTNPRGETKQIIDHNLNDPTIVKHTPAIPLQAERTIDADDARKYGAPF